MKLQTQRLILRPIESTDNQSVFNYRKDTIINKYQGWIPKTIEEVNQFISTNPSEFNQTGTWFQLVIIEKSTNKLIGDVGVHFVDKYQCEIGCTLSKQKHGQGFATEALKGVICYLFSELSKHRITASIDPKNSQSINMVKRLGFRKEAHFIESLFFKGEWVDDIIYAILKREWK